jgi:hypothetical protein
MLVGFQVERDQGGLAGEAQKYLVVSLKGEALNMLGI